MEFRSIEELKENGFEGFISVEKLQADSSLIPKKMGVYMVLFPDGQKVEFLSKGTGGHFKDKNPNVEIKILEESWINETPIIYIGKAGGQESSATLQSRLKQYLKFGQGQKIGHWGGRYIWQVKDSKNLIFCWKALSDKEPREEEATLIESFKEKFRKRPFANLVK